MAAVGVRVMVSVKRWMQQTKFSHTEGRGSVTYETLKNVTTALKNHKALLGWCELLLALLAFCSVWRKSDNAVFLGFATASPLSAASEDSV